MAGAEAASAAHTRLLVAGLVVAAEVLPDGMAIPSVPLTLLRLLPSLLARLAWVERLALLRLVGHWRGRAVRAATRNLERMYMQAVAVAVGRVRLLQQAVVAAAQALELLSAALELPLAVEALRVVALMAERALLEVLLIPHLTALRAEDALRRAYHSEAGITFWVARLPELRAQALPSQARSLLPLWVLALWFLGTLAA